VAGIAGKGGRDVIPRLGAGRDAMTGGAGTRDDAGMGEAHAHPGSGPMAGVAGLVGERMIRRFSLGDAVVVALGALVSNDASMTEPGHTPRRGGGMTLFTR